MTRSPKRDPKQTLVASRTLTGSVTTSAKPRQLPQRAARGSAPQEDPANVSTKSRTTRA